MPNLYVDSDTLYKLDAVVHARTGAVITGATVTVELFKKGTTAQIGDDITMTEVGVTGYYWCLIPNGNTLYAGEDYYITVTIVKDSEQLVKRINLDAVWST